MLDEEVGNPGEAVGYDDGGGDEPFVAVIDGRENKRPADESAGEMENASERLAVSENVMGPEIGEGAGLLHGGIVTREGGEAIKKNATAPLRAKRDSGATAGVKLLLSG